MKYPLIDPRSAARGVVPPTDMDLEVEAALRRRFVTGCQSCGGRGPNECVCMQSFRRALHYHRVRIPERYWPLSMNDWTGDVEAGETISTWMRHIHEFKNEGVGFMLFSHEGMETTGTGKTMLLCMALKHAVDCGYTARYYPMTTLRSEIFQGFSDRDFAERQKIIFERVEVLALDDIGRESRGAMGNNEEMLRDRLDSLIRARDAGTFLTLGATDHSPVSFHKHYGMDTISLIAGSMKSIAIKGVDERRQGVSRAVSKWDRIAGVGDAE